MPTKSSYWKSQMNNSRKQIDALEDDIEELKKIKVRVENNLSDEVSNINGKINDLKEDLGKSVRHNSTFNANKNRLNDEKEQFVYNDNFMNAVVRWIQEEINQLNRKTEAEQNNLDAYNRQYNNAKSAEDEERRKKIEKIFD